MRHTVCAALILIGLFRPSAARAQGDIGGPDPAKVRVRIGALWLNPTIGLSNHVGRELRLGFNVDKARRASEVESRPYEGLKDGTSLTYGF
jgi:hypothetical protein